jgi:hypothetical protein
MIKVEVKNQARNLAKERSPRTQLYNNYGRNVKINLMPIVGVISGVKTQTPKTVYITVGKLGRKYKCFLIPDLL